MAKRRRAAAKKIPVQYINDDVSIEYVGRSPSELRTELERVQTAIFATIRILSTMKRIRHAVIKTVRFQLDHAVRELPPSATDEEVADEIARLSFLMEDTLTVLNKLCHCRVANIEQARFKLTYGQTPKKREPPAKYGNKASQKKEEE